MNTKRRRRVALPKPEQVEAELMRVKRRSGGRRVFRDFVFLLVIIAAITMLISVLLMPVMRIYGDSMAPTLNAGDVVLAIKNARVQTGDVVGVYYGSKLLVKRVIATENQWVDMDGTGNVYVDGVLLEEPYVTEKSLGECDIDLPYQVPEGTVFVMGDHRIESIDSRSSVIGCIEKGDILGKALVRVWPIKAFGRIKSD
ncbi:MAG: signal peptidase I [Clostridia bacterium]|nr:signal peptidase I [Clostridia bacterium]